MQEDVHEGKSNAKAEHKSISAFCNIITKAYFLIVVATFTTHYSVVPIHTRKSPSPSWCSILERPTLTILIDEKKGLIGKEHYEHEFVSIRDGNIKDSAFQPLSKYKPLVTDISDDERYHKMNVLSTAHITKLYQRRFDLPVTCHGRLTEESTKRLLKWVEAEQKRGLGLWSNLGRQHPGAHVGSAIWHAPIEAHKAALKVRWEWLCLKIPRHYGMQWEVYEGQYTQLTLYNLHAFTKRQFVEPLLMNHYLDQKAQKS